jgi:hypothetical protein
LILMDDKLIDLQPDWEKAWTGSGMPEYDQKDLEPWQSVVVHFSSLLDREAFFALIGQPELTSKSPYCWFPRTDRIKHTYKNEASVKVPQGRHPIYVISKGRWDSNITARNLEDLRIKYNLVVEPQEFQKYYDASNSWRVRGNIIPLPHNNYGQGCSIPARNWCWDHSMKTGAERHWILDDNIQGFYKLNRNQKPKITNENPFIPIEEFTDHYKNVGISGPNYEFFTQRRTAMPAFYKNTRVYSCILIKNDLPFRWRGRYNEDTDLCLRVLQAGFCTVLFNYIQAKKVATLRMGGGNTDSLYKLKDEDGRLKMAESLKAQHPSLVKITRKWGRWQHHVNYKPFSHLQLIPR